MLESIEFPETVIAMAIEPESTAERKKLAETLEMMKRQDPTFLAAENEETGQTLISGMGELHLEVIKHRLLREFNLDVKVHKPRVNYRETVAKSAEVVGECNRQMGGEQLYARLTIKLEPSQHEGAPVLVTSRCPPESLDGELLMAALDELQGCSEGVFSKANRSADNLRARRLPCQGPCLVQSRRRGKSCVTDRKEF